MEERGGLLFEHIIRMKYLLMVIGIWIWVGPAVYLIRSNIDQSIVVVCSALFLTFLVMAAYVTNLSSNYKIYTNGIEMDVKFVSKSPGILISHKHVFYTWDKIKSIRHVKGVTILFLKPMGFRYFIRATDDRIGDIVVSEKRAPALLKSLKTGLGKRWNEVYDDTPMELSEYFEKYGNEKLSFL